VSTIIRNPKDFWAGVIFVVVAVIAIYVSKDYSMGRAGRMGPAYFPTMVGWLLALGGTALVLRGVLTKGEPVGRWALKEMTLVTLGTVLFGILIRHAGLMAAIVAVVLVGGYASTQFKLKPYLILAAGAAAFAAMVFVYALGLPMPLLGTWFSN
jgi:hypothetical protein